MDSTEIIKAIVPHFCPHCQQEIFVKIHSLPPSLASVLTRADIAAAKEDVLNRLSKKLDAKTFDMVSKEIREERVMFGPEDVTGIVSQYTE